LQSDDSLTQNRVQGFTISRGVATGGLERI
jgi:hypothetical protein